MDMCMEAHCGRRDIARRCRVEVRVVRRCRVARRGLYGLRVDAIRALVVISCVVVAVVVVVVVVVVVIVVIDERLQRPRRAEHSHQRGVVIAEPLVAAG